MKFLRKPKAEGKGEPIEPQADLSDILASLSMRLERVERRLDALEMAPLKSQVGPQPPPLPKMPVLPKLEAEVKPTIPAKPILKPKRPKIRKPKPVLKKPPVKKPLGKPSPAVRVKPRELKVGVERAERVVKLKPVKLTRGKTIRPFRKEG